MKLLAILLCLACHFYSISGYLITVDAHAQECFFEKVKKDTKMALTFEIADGGFLDIDINIFGPDGNIIHKEERESHGKYTFSASIDGTYTYCFSNQQSTLTTKIVMFKMDVTEPQNTTNVDLTKDGEEANHMKLETMIKDLEVSLRTVRNDQEYMQLRDRIHRTINESTNFGVVLWSIFEATVLVLMTIGQIFYLKRFFEVRRVV